MAVDLDDADVPVRALDARRRLSAIRVLGALLLIGLLSGGGWLLIRNDATEAQPFAGARGWSAPYVDVTITPFFAFEDPGEPVSDVILAFVVADTERPCTPSWGAAFDLEEAAVALDLDRRLVRLRQIGKDAVVAFGGLANDELALACRDTGDLADAYRAVVERYGVSTVDFDIEGSALDDTDAHRRRAVAVADVQRQRSEDGHDLAVWLTVPVSPSGIPDGALAALDALLHEGVDVAGVNVMTMNFATSGTEGSQYELAAGSLESTAIQLRGAWDRAGTRLTPGEVWSRMGATPMIGRNDTVAETFTLDDAARLADLALTKGLARLSYWSLNRDRPCPPGEVDLVRPSNVCAHVEQEALAFATALGVAGGRPSDLAGESRFAEVELIPDDPDRSPYPIWRPDRAYEANSKVVWHGYVYEAKWWSHGDDPEEPVLQVWDTPWRIVGPVLAADLLEPVELPAGVAPRWDGSAVYEEGDRVLFDGQVYEAKWWNTEFQPNREVAAEWDTPWRELDPRAVLAELDR